MPVFRPDALGREAGEIRRMFGDLPVVDAKADIVVYVTADEMAKGKRGDPHNCMFSQACKRAFGAEGVLFYPTVAYIDMIEPPRRDRKPRKRIVMRFTLPADTRRELERFDRGKPGAAREATFYLLAVPPGRTLAAKARKSRVARLRTAGETDATTAERRQRRATAARKGHETRRSRALLGIRSGSGQVHTDRAV